MKDKAVITIKNFVKGNVQFNEPLSRHTSFKIGGPVDLWVEPSDLDDLKRLLEFSVQFKVPFFVIGGGNNVLFSDRGFRGIVVRLSSPYFKRIDLHGNTVSAGSGVSLNMLLDNTFKFGLSGCEFLAGIPGTVGGALTVNAGLKGRGMGDLAEEVATIELNGDIRVSRGRKLKFGYRASSLSECIILNANLRLKRADKRKVALAINGFLEHKRQTQETILPTAGCIFKNPPNFPQTSGELIERSGLKGKRIGDASVSTKHANFIVNRGSARSQDVLGLIRLIQKKVKFDHGLWLEPEIRIVG